MPPQAVGNRTDTVVLGDGTMPIYSINGSMQGPEWEFMLGWFVCLSLAGSHAVALELPLLVFIELSLHSNMASSI